MKKVITVPTLNGPQLVEVDSRSDRRFELVKIFLSTKRHASSAFPLGDNEREARWIKQCITTADKVLDALEAHEAADDL